MAITFQDLLDKSKNPNFIDSSSEDRTALLVMNKIKRYQKKNSASRTPTGYTTSSVHSRYDANTVECDHGTSSPHVSSFIDLLFQVIRSFIFSHLADWQNILYLLRFSL